MFTHVVPFGLGLDQSLLCRGNRGGAGANGLANARQSGLGLLHGNFVGLGIDAEKGFAGLDPLIVDNIDLGHPPGNVRSHPHNEGLNRRLRRVRRHAVGDDRIEEQPHNQAENDEGPSPHGITRCWGLLGHGRHCEWALDNAESGEVPKNLSGPRPLSKSSGDNSF